MIDSKRALIKNFCNYNLSDNFNENWSDIMYIAEIIVKMNSFNSGITIHEKRLLNDLKLYVKNSILMFDKSKSISCIIDFISTYNIIFPRKYKNKK